MLGLELADPPGPDVHVTTVTRVIRFADGRSDSVGEPLGRVGLAVAGVPTPVLQ